MNKYILILYILTQFIWSQNNPYEEFQLYMNSSEGRVLNIHFFQNQLGQEFESDGTLYYSSNGSYTFDNASQRINFNKNIITTTNKVSRQIIYDFVIPSEITIFDILSGDNKNVQIDEVIIEKDGFRIPFKIYDWDISGTIWTTPSTGKPKEIILSFSNNSDIRIQIKSSTLMKNGSIPEINTNGYEVIDLRE